MKIASEECEFNDHMVGELPISRVSDLVDVTICLYLYYGDPCQD